MMRNGRNIENMIDYIAGVEDGESKTSMIRSLAIYMRQQYLIWNKDTVSDQTIFQDIENMSGNRIKVPEGLQLAKVEAAQGYSRPGQKQGKNQWQRGNQNKRKHNK